MCLTLSQSGMSKLSRWQAELKTLVFMCYHKSFAATYEKLMEHYSASFNSITEELGLVKERFSIMMSRDEKTNPFTNDEVKEVKNLKKVIDSFTDTHFKRYHENGFDFLPSPVITVGSPKEFRFFNWGLVPYYMSDRDKAFALRVSTLNCISEEMYEKPS